MNTETKQRILDNITGAARQVTALLAEADEAFGAMERGESFDLAAVRAEMNEAHALASKFLLWAHHLVLAQPDDTARASVHPGEN